MAVEEVPGNYPCSPQRDGVGIAGMFLPSFSGCEVAARPESRPRNWRASCLVSCTYKRSACARILQQRQADPRLEGSKMLKGVLIADANGCGSKKWYQDGMVNGAKE